MTQLTLSSSRHANLVRKPTRSGRKPLPHSSPSPAAWWPQAPAHLPTADGAAGPCSPPYCGRGRWPLLTPLLRTAPLAPAHPPTADGAAGPCSPPYCGRRRWPCGTVCSQCSGARKAWRSGSSSHKPNTVVCGAFLVIRRA